jgi:uncharacterized protein YciI
VAAVRPAHRAYIEGLVRDGKVGAAGRFADESGGLFLFRAGDGQEPAKLADDDPYHVEGAAERRTVREFDPVIAFGGGPE